MAYRGHSWDKELAYQLHTDKRFAELFFKGLIDEGEDPTTVIRRVVRAYGIQELSEKVNVRPQSIVRVLRSPKKAKEDTLNKIMKPFGVKVEKQLAIA